ncbi:hypothetical protein BE221DRAFT_205993 [Ostreococcus tauri]|uniref:Uncharacterized protein n=1 Tax=Ostreococcus tauri TaxID=70448 RepID=A0A1Y5ICB4_OSTTA|nr:hypothetical protein BE221DRAFT_205993 [Ostreococcus tauri]
MREKPSAAPVATFSWRTKTERMFFASESAPTMCISVVPGLAKHTSTPLAAATAHRADAPVSSASSSSFAILAGTARDEVPSMRDL